MAVVIATKGYAEKATRAIAMLTSKSLAATVNPNAVESS